jgi:EAL domain-containing protein (putative c-di-GMP-specific phosphodiesterase class I)
MTVEQAVLEKLRELPPERQQEVLDFVESLQQKSEPKRPHHSLMGLWTDLGVKITREDIDEARREMWGAFSREDF